MLTYRVAPLLMASAMTAAVPAPSPASATDYLNEAFGKEDRAMLARGVRSDHDKVWLSRRCADFANESTCTDKIEMSWFAMNKLLWDETRSRHTVYETNDGTGKVGYIATPETPIRCAFPTDGGTVSRGLHGCGAHHLFYSLFPFLNYSNWCSVPGPSPDDFVRNWPGYDLMDLINPSLNRSKIVDALEYTGCAFQPDRLPEVLRIYAAAKKAQKVTRRWSVMFDLITPQPKEVASAGAWNEILVDGAMWNGVAGTNIYAWYIMEDCLTTPRCSDGFDKIREDYKTAYGVEPPAVLFNPLNKDTPFSAYTASAGMSTAEAVLI